MRWPWPLVAAILLAGCTGFDEARSAAEETQQALADARREAQEARERFDRVSSATIVREESVRVVIVPMSNATRIWFDTAAYRGEVLLARENLTSIPPVRIRGAGIDLACDPLTCHLAQPDADVTVTWDDGADGEVLLRGGQDACADATASDACARDRLTRQADVRVTTDASDVTA